MSVRWSVRGSTPRDRRRSDYIGSLLGNSAAMRDFSAIRRPKVKHPPHLLRPRQIAHPDQVNDRDRRRLAPEQLAFKNVRPVDIFWLSRMSGLLTMAWEGAGLYLADFCEILRERQPSPPPQNSALSRKREFAASSSPSAGTYNKQ